MYNVVYVNYNIIIIPNFAAGDDEISFDPDDIIENIEQVYYYRNHCHII